MGFYQFYVCHQLFIFGLHLFIRFLADCVFFQKRMLAVDTVFRQWYLSCQLLQFRLQRLVVDLGKQVAGFHVRAFRKIDGHDLARRLKREVYLLIRNRTASYLI